MLNIIVCVKQVPASFEVKMNKETNTIIREGMESVINPFDLYAIEEAIRIKEELGGKVTAISMGIPSVAEILKNAVAMGLDDAILLSDKAFAGADSLATSYALSMGIRNIGGYDLIICGKQATDGDTAQVGPSLAEKLGIPHTTYVKKIEEIRDGYIRCHRLVEDGYEVIEMSLPALITVVKDINQPRLPSLRGIMRAKNAVKIWAHDDINADKDLCGLKGSPTQVIHSFIQTSEHMAEMLEGQAEEQARQLVDKLFSSNSGFNL